MQGAKNYNDERRRWVGQFLGMNVFLLFVMDVESLLIVIEIVCRG